MAAGKRKKGKDRSSNDHDRYRLAFKELVVAHKEIERIQPPERKGPQYLTGEQRELIKKKKQAFLNAVKAEKVKTGDEIRIQKEVEREVELELSHERVQDVDDHSHSRNGQG